MRLGLLSVVSCASDQVLAHVVLEHWASPVATVLGKGAFVTLLSTFS